MPDKQPSEEEFLAVMRSLLEMPAVKKMADVDVWGRENGLDSEKRGAVVTAISHLVVSSTDPKIVYEYVVKVAEAITELGPELLKSISENTKAGGEKNGL